MNFFHIANLKKAIYYMKRNGLGRTIGAMRERLDRRSRPPYHWAPISGEEGARQRAQAESGFSQVLFSIVVPTYRTPERYLKDMITSVINQTYPHWELILADATEGPGTAVDGKVRQAPGPAGDGRVKQAPGPAGDGKVRQAPGPAVDGRGAAGIRATAEAYGDTRIRYCHLPANAGIAENTNQGIALAKGDYVGLLDHDDLLAENALYEMALRIEQGRAEGIHLQLLYSDEDKCDGEGKEYYDPNFKEDFNLDLLLSNNYICHFMVMKRELIQTLRLRKEYDGAQDFDLVLRGASQVMDMGQEKGIAHIPKVLYHWRCHRGSTAENPQSKLYAYEAGRRAVQDFADGRNWAAKAADTEHLGFYRLVYGGDIFKIRQELAALGGPVVRKRRIIGGRMSPRGEVFYEGLPVSYSGYLHRAALQQEAEALDIRNIEVREGLRGLFEEVTGVMYKKLPGTEVFDPAGLPAGTDYKLLSLKLGASFRRRGYKLLYLPERARDAKGVSFVFGGRAESVWKK